MTASPEFVVRCGKGLFLGPQGARVASADRARRFAAKGEAEVAARELRSRGSLFTLPWAVEEAPALEGEAAATVPSVDPLTLLTMIRLAVPDADHVRESDLRTLMVEVDRHIAEYIAAMFRRQQVAEVDPA